MEKASLAGEALGLEAVLEEAVLEVEMFESGEPQLRWSSSRRSRWSWL